jgi:hypothetical protein
VRNVGADRLSRGEAQRAAFFTALSALGSELQTLEVPFPDGALALMRAAMTEAHRHCETS